MDPVQCKGLIKGVRCFTILREAGVVKRGYCIRCFRKKDTEADKIKESERRAEVREQESKKRSHEVHNAKLRATNERMAMNVQENSDLKEESDILDQEYELAKAGKLPGALPRVSGQFSELKKAQEEMSVKLHSAIAEINRLNELGQAVTNERDALRATMKEMSEGTGDQLAKLAAENAELKENLRKNQDVNNQLSAQLSSLHQQVNQPNAQAKPNRNRKNGQFQGRDVEMQEFNQNPTSLSLLHQEQNSHVQAPGN